MPWPSLPSMLCGPSEIAALTHLWGYLAQDVVLSDGHFVLISSRLSLHT